MEVLDENEILPFEKDNLIKCVRWWEKKRIPYNLLLVGLVTLFMLYYAKGTIRFGIEEAITQSILFILVANVFFTIGWGFEVLIHYYTKGHLFKNRFRMTLYILGVLFSIYLTSVLYIGTLEYFQMF